MSEPSETPAAYWDRLKKWGLYALMVVLAVIVNALIAKWLGKDAQIPSVPIPLETKDIPIQPE